MDMHMLGHVARQIPPAFAERAPEVNPSFALRRVTITENSQELERIHSGGRGLRSTGYLDGYDEETHGQHNRSLLARVVHAAYEDIELAMRRRNPRLQERKVGGKVLQSENFAFRSAIHFFFAREPIADAAGQQAWFSVFNSYCVLLGLQAARIRGSLLVKFGPLEKVVLEIIKDPLYMARVERVGGASGVSGIGQADTMADMRTGFSAGDRKMVVTGKNL